MNTVPSCSSTSMSSAYSGTNGVTLIQSDGIISLQQFVDFSSYVPEAIKEKEHVINSVTNVNSGSYEIHNLVKERLLQLYYSGFGLSSFNKKKAKTEVKFSKH